jgi:hypothetical protein
MYRTSELRLRKRLGVIFEIVFGQNFEYNVHIYNQKHLLTTLVFSLQNQYSNTINGIKIRYQKLCPNNTSAD